MALPIAKLVVDGEEFELDMNQLWLSEAVILERDWGLSADEFQQQVLSGTPSFRTLGAMVWLAKVRKLAADSGSGFAQAAEQIPVATFDTNLMALAPVEAPPEPTNPTSPATRSPATRTSRATSAKPRSKRN